MFTGIIETVGRLQKSRDSHISIESNLKNLSLGESVSVQGVCLTVTKVGVDLFEADLSEETLSRTTIGGFVDGREVNLERALRADGRLGGHIVQGHIDGTAEVSSVAEMGSSVEISFQLEPEWLKYVTQKGSIAVDGVSLTVARLLPEGFAVSLIPKTLEDTTLKTLKPGDSVNIEVDILAKYVERLLGKD